MTPVQILELVIGVGFLCVLILLLRRFGAGEGRLPYFCKDFLLSRGETAFYHALRRALPSHLMICPKVRLGDILGCSAEGWKAGFGAKISQKHLDFVLADIDTTAVALAIELDDRTHQRADRQERDAFLDRALSTAGVPILRIPAAAAYDVAALKKQIAGLIKDTGDLEQEPRKM
ncbi:MAG TPA: DUF2726 domain-containing protein [Tepidisphaeraceae bacterium]|jgi:very-short-patch-repair endonuclease|nr:DUF2726 domain-containing protein [Tepidisphaeraceae bacterium]